MRKNDTEGKEKIKTLKSNYVRTYLLAVLIPVLLTGIITFVMVYIYKQISISQPYLTLISIFFPSIVVLISVAVCFYCEYSFMKRQYEKIDYITDRFILGRFDHLDHDLNTMEDNNMIDQMNAVADKLSESTRKAVHFSDRCDKLENERLALQFSLLTAKSEPEFINRALTKLKEYAQAGDKETFIQIATDMVEFTQAQLLDSSQLISLADEVKLIKRYIDLYKLTGIADVNYRIAIMCNIVDYRIIPHVVFPVVSNFLEFALRSGANQCDISVEITAAQSGLAITIRDNGAGMSLSNLEQIRLEIENDVVDPFRSSISLPNINHRIKLYYGEKYGLKIAGGVMGNMVTIIVPRKKR